MLVSISLFGDVLDCINDIYGAEYGEGSTGKYDLGLREVDRWSYLCRKAVNEFLCLK